MSKTVNSPVSIYDTTLRDGSQGEGISFSCDDKLKILRILDDFQIDYVEGGWPGSNPKDLDFFHAARDLEMKHTRLAAFGSTARPRIPAEEDANLRCLLESGTPVVTIFGKSWRLHVTEVFRTTLEENLLMIGNSIRHLHEQGREVIYDAEHFFDGYEDDPEYALSTLNAAMEGGADWVVLCDTNGGTLTHRIGEITTLVQKRFPGARLGIHTHNDSGLAIANSLEAVRQGAVQVQGTFNGLGERCGNADLAVVIPNLALKMGRQLSVGSEGLNGLSRTARHISAIANHNFPENHPYIGQMAFAHKGGVHVNSVMKVARSYEHIDPQLVGNSRRVLISELSGKSNLEFFAEQNQIDLSTNSRAARASVEEIKRLENQGYVFEGAEASSTLVLLKFLGKLPDYFDLVTYRTINQHTPDAGGKSRHRAASEATVKIRVGGEEHLAVGEGVGPVDALDAALRGAIKPFFPEVDGVHLSDYKVRVIDENSGTHAKVRVLIESTDSRHHQTWGAVGVSDNLIEASWIALRDSVVYGIYQARNGKTSLPEKSQKKSDEKKATC